GDVEGISDANGAASVQVAEGTYNYSIRATGFFTHFGSFGIHADNSYNFVLVAGPENLIHYWNFNDNSSFENLIYPTYSIGNASLNYDSDWDDVNDNTDINEYYSSSSSRALRLRNPAGDFIITAPTTGHENIKLKYAANRTSNGMERHIVEYSVDGENFSSEGLTDNEVSLSTNYHLYEFDFSAIEAANNNANFKIRIRFEGQTIGLLGNNRIDNLSIESSLGDTDPDDPNSVLAEKLGTAFIAFPNPAVGTSHVFFNKQASVKVYNTLGDLLKVEENKEAMDISQLNPGMYYLVTDTGESFKLIVK
ncbi:MAG: T9SS type A sorting domain-containing protein, partial [Cytophagaceae bacterium]